MRKVFQRMFKKDPRTVAIHEFAKIKDLYAKLDKLEVVGEAQIEMKEVQRNVLYNNFDVIAHTFELENTLDTESRDGLFNMQGTSKRVIGFTGTTSFHDFSEDIKNNHPVNVKVFLEELSPDIDFSLEQKFMKLNSKVKPMILSKIRKMVENRVKKASIKLAETVPYNEDVFYDFIMYNFEENDYFNYSNFRKIRRRYKIAYNLVMNYNFDDSYDIDSKDIIFFDNSASNNIDLGEFANHVKTKRYDFIVTGLRKEEQYH